MIIQAYYAKGKRCAHGVAEHCVRWDCMSWRWHKSVPKTTKFTTVNKDDFKGFCGESGEPVSEAVITDV